MRLRSKKMLSMTAAAALGLVAVAGCGSKSSTTTSSDNTSSTSSSAGGGSDSSSTGSTSSSAAPGKPGGTLVIGTGGVFTTNNSPFAPTSSATANGWIWLIYEPLEMNNTVDPTAKPAPWLAESTTWTPDFKSVTFKARDGVKWNDGQSFSAADIAYTFDLLKSNAALNPNNLDIEAATASGSSATVTFNSPQFVNQTKITGQAMLPEHIWKSIKDPATDANAKPVGTGPFLFDSNTSSVAKLKKNPDYWQADKVNVGEVIYQALQGNDPIINALAGHSLDWAGASGLNLKTGYLDKSPRNKGWIAPQLSAHSFFINTQKPPFDNVHLREAISYAIDRGTAAKLASGGLSEAVTSVTGLPQPVGDSFIAPEFKDQKVGLDLDKAKAALKAGGFTLDNGVLKESGGKAVTMELTDPAGYTDYLTELQVIGQNLQAIGIKTTLNTPSADAWGNAIKTGNYDGAMHWSNSGATPYDMYASWMDGSLVKTMGTAMTGNFPRFNNPDATAALKSYATAADDAARTKALATVEKVFTEQYPVVPIAPNANIGMFTTVHWTGWPGPDDPYAAPGILGSNILVILTTLQPVG